MCETTDTNRYRFGYANGDWRTDDDARTFRAPLPCYFDLSRSWTGGMVPMFAEREMRIVVAEQEAMGGAAMDADTLTWDGPAVVYRSAQDADHVQTLHPECIGCDDVPRWAMDCGWTWGAWKGLDPNTPAPAVLALYADDSADDPYLVWGDDELDPAPLAALADAAAKDPTAYLRYVNY